MPDSIGQNRSTFIDFHKFLHNEGRTEVRIFDYGVEGDVYGANFVGLMSVNLPYGIKKGRTSPSSCGSLRMLQEPKPRRLPKLSSRSRARRS